MANPSESPKPPQILPSYEALRENKTLENHLIGLATNATFFSYKDRPRVITSGGIEAYLNYLSKLTQTDSLKRERADAVRLNLHDENFLHLSYNTDPPIADEDKPNTMKASGHNEDPLLFDVLYPHSHPNASTFSPQDYQIIFADYGDNRFNPIAAAIAGPHNNYLLLRTQESKYISPTELGKTIPKMKDIIRLSEQLFRTELNDLYRTFDEPSQHEFIHNVKFATELLMRGSNPAVQLATLLLTKHMAGIQQFGFYQSDKKGTFRTVTTEDLDIVLKDFCKLVGIANPEAFAFYNYLKAEIAKIQF